MADIRIDVNGALTDGQEISFKAPCDCTAIEGLKIYYTKNGERFSEKFVMKDAHGNNLKGIGNLFESGAYIKAILDTVQNFAYLQNADTNAYLEGKITPVNNLLSTATGLPLSAAQGKKLHDNMGGCVFSSDDNGAYVTYTANGATVKKKLGEPTYLGEGTSFDVSSYEGYEKFTVDNFYIRPSGSISTSNFGGETEYTGNRIDNCGVNSLTASIMLSYNASNGILTSYLSASATGGANNNPKSTKTASGTASVKAYLVP